MHHTSAAFVVPTTSRAQARVVCSSYSRVSARQQQQGLSPLRMGSQTEEEVLTKVKAIVVQQLAVEESQVVPSASFTQDLGADSLDTVELIMALEEGFNVSFPFT